MSGDGNIVSTDKQQDAKLAQPELAREIATIGDGRDITRGFIGPLMVSQDLLLQTRGAGDLRLYEQILSDGDVQSTLSQRRNAVIKCAFDVRPGGKAAIDKEAAEFLKDQLKAINFDRVTGGMHYGVFYGYAVSEVIYGQEGSKITLKDIKVRNRRRFAFAPDQTLRLRTFDNMIPGEKALPPYFWHFRTGADNDDEPYGLGLAHWLYWPVFFKRNDIKFWLIFLDKFGMPTGVGKYDQGASQGEKDRLLAAIAAIQTDTGIIMPKDMEIALLEAGRSGTPDYKTLHDTMVETIAKVVLGQTLTSQVGATGGNSRGLGNVHMEVRQDLVKADADLICESFNLGPARWLTEWNFPGAKVPEVYRDVEEPEDLAARATRDKTVYGMGYKPTLDYITQTYGGEWTETSTPPALPFGGTPNDDAAFAEGGVHIDPPAQMATSLDRALGRSTDAWINQIRALVGKASSLEEVRDGLIALAPSMSLDQYNEVMAQALAAAALAGRYEILSQAGAV